MEKKTIRKCVNIAPPSICLIFSRGRGGFEQGRPPPKKKIINSNKKKVP